MDKRSEKLTTGILGAVLGAILGGVFIILLGELGLLSAASGVILAFCTMKGYGMLGGKLSLRGFYVSIGVMLPVPYLADRISWAMNIAEESAELLGASLSFWDAFLQVHGIVAKFGRTVAYWQNLLFIYAFVGLGIYTIWRQAFKRKRED